MGFESLNKSMWNSWPLEWVPRQDFTQRLAVSRLYLDFLDGQEPNVGENTRVGIGDAGTFLTTPCWANNSQQDWDASLSLPSLRQPSSIPYGLLVCVAGYLVLVRTRADGLRSSFFMGSGSSAQLGCLDPITILVTPFNDPTWRSPQSSSLLGNHNAGNSF